MNRRHILLILVRLVAFAAVVEVLAIWFFWRSPWTPIERHYLPAYFAIHFHSLAHRRSKSSGYGRWDAIRNGNSPRMTTWWIPQMEPVWCSRSPPMMQGGRRLFKVLSRRFRHTNSGLV